MLLREIPSEFSFNMQVHPILSDKVLPNSGIGNIKPGIDKGEYQFFINGKVYDIEITNKNKINDFNLYMKRGCANLSEILIKNPDGTAEIKTIFFYGGTVNMENIDIAVDDRIIETAKRNNISCENTDDLAQELNKRLTVSVNNETYFVAMFGNASIEDFETEKSETDEISEEIKSGIPDIEKFSIYGTDVKIPVEKKKNIENEGDVFFANKIVFGRHNKKEAALRLVKADIKFSDYSRAQTSKISAIAAGAMNRLCRKENSYLKKWD
jgi:hypothetical protein